MNKSWLAGLRTGAIVWAVGRAVWPYVKMAFLITLGIVVAPSIERYWANRMVAVPTVPLLAIVLMFVSAVFMIAAAAILYVVGLLIVQIVRIERNRAPAAIALGVPPASIPAGPVAQTGGSFIPADDDSLYLREQLDLLKKKGITTDTDTMDLEEMAKQIGLKTIMEKRGRTE